MTPLPSYVHIGFHKTGTTFLQRELFARHPEIHLRNTASYFLEDEEYARGAAHYAGMGASEEASGMVVVESSEGLSGGMFEKGGYALLAERIRETCPEAAVLVLIRNQKTMLESLYKQYVKERGELPFERFLRSGIGRQVLEKIEYVQQIGFYRETFGDRLRVRLFEEMVRERNAFAGGILRDLGVQPFQPSSQPQNRGATVFVGGLYRKLNKLCRASDRIDRHRRSVRHVLDFLNNNLIRYLDRRKYVKDRHESLFRRYSEANRTLSTWIALDLRAHGYP